MYNKQMYSRKRFQTTLLHDQLDTTRAGNRQQQQSCMPFNGRDANITYLASWFGFSVR